MDSPGAIRSVTLSHISSYLSIARMKNGVSSFTVIFSMGQAMPLRPVAFERRAILNEGYKNSVFFFGMHLNRAPTCDASCTL
jgi:hypothetical protein